MSLDDWNLLAASVAAVLATAGLVYQIRRDRRMGRPAFVVAVENETEQGGTRIVLQSIGAGDATWSITSIEVLAPRGAVLVDNMKVGHPTGVKITVHPPELVPRAAGIYALELRLPHAVPRSALRVELKVRLRNVEGRVAVAPARGYPQA